VDSGVDPTAVEAEPTASTEETVEENSNDVPF